MRPRTVVGLISLALVAGIGTGEIVCRSRICRDAIGGRLGRGKLIALINGHGIYEIETKAEAAADSYLAGPEVGATSAKVVLQRLIANEILRQVSDRIEVSETELQREVDLLRDQIQDEKSWTKRMADSGISMPALRQRIQENLAGRSLIEQEITNLPGPSEDSLRNYYREHVAEFSQPVRLRASHIFLAAPPAASPEIVQAKQKLIESLALRLRGGEEFEALVWEESEDEASKRRAGDLGYFSQWRVPPDFFEMVSKLRIGETSKPFRSTLGFHLVRVTEIRPARQITFEEARNEIALSLTNQNRRKAIEALPAGHGGSSPLRRGLFWN
jgi:parvulin-like peptidyl-prolyl isomerase